MRTSLLTLNLVFSALLLCTTTAVAQPAALPPPPPAPVHQPVVTHAPAAPQQAATAQWQHYPPPQVGMQTMPGPEIDHRGVRASRPLSVDIGLLGFNGPNGIVTLHLNYQVSNYIGLEAAGGYGWTGPNVGGNLNITFFGSGNHSLMLSPGASVTLARTASGVTPIPYPNLFLGYNFQHDNGFRFTVQAGLSALVVVPFPGVQLARFGYAF